MKSLFWKVECYYGERRVSSAGTYSLVVAMAICIFLPRIMAGADSTAKQFAPLPDSIIANDAHTSKYATRIPQSPAIILSKEPESSPKWFEIVQTLGIFTGVVAVGFLWFQIKEQNRLSRATILSNIAQRTETINSLIFEHPELSEYVDDAADPTHWDDTITVRVGNYYYHVLNVLEEIYDYRKLKLVDDEDWVAWENSFRRYIRQKAFVMQWSQIHNEYSKSFQNEIDGLLKELADRKNVPSKHPLNPIGGSEDVEV
jgi:hypothetical protein